MSGFFWFIIGWLIGGLCGMILLALLVANDENDEWYDD